MTADAPKFYGHPMTLLGDSWYPVPLFKPHRLRIRADEEGYTLCYSDDYYGFGTAQEAADFAMALCEETREFLNDLYARQVK